MGWETPVILSSTAVCKARRCSRVADAIPRPSGSVRGSNTDREGSVPATGEEHRARIVLPNGFEFKEAEMGTTVHCRVSAGEKLTFELKNTYAQLNAFDWSN
jgi:hypothetical protein